MCECIIHYQGSCVQGLTLDGVKRVWQARDLGELGCTVCLGLIPPEPDRDDDPWAWEDWETVVDEDMADRIRCMDHGGEQGTRLNIALEMYLDFGRTQFPPPLR